MPRKPMHLFWKIFDRLAYSPSGAVTLSAQKNGYLGEYQAYKLKSMCAIVNELYRL